VSEAEITLHVSEDGDDSNEGSRERPLWSVAAALEKVRWQPCRGAVFVIHGSITEVAARSAMIDITGRGLPVIFLRGESPEHPGRLNAAGLNKRVIYVSDGNTLYLEDNVILCGGAAQGSGGSGVTLESGTLIMRGGEISGNDSGVGMGGGVYAGKGSEFIMEGGLIRNNKTALHGGGVFPDEGGIFTMSGGIIFGNTACICGGGVFVGLGSVFEMTGGRIERNITGTENKVMLMGIPVPRGRGGGVFVSEKTCFRMRGGEIADNRAIVIHMDDSDAGSGGGVFVEQGGSFYFEGGAIRKNMVMNWGGGVYTEGAFTALPYSVISNNAARLGGGGVHVAGEKAGFTMKGCLLSNNFTAGAGGGINITAGGAFIMDDGFIKDNSALKMGNALAIDGPASINGGTVLAADHADQDNRPPAGTAEKNTSGIHIAGAGKLTLRGGLFDGSISMKDQSQFEDLRGAGINQRPMRLI
jgi:hypothetical protein